MANTHKQFSEFEENLRIPKSKREAMITSRNKAEEIITKWFEENQPDYPISYWIQGSHKNDLNIRTLDESCDQDHGVFIDRDPADSVSGTTLQKWIVEALTGSSSTTPAHKKRCVRNFYQGGNLGPYHIDYPVYYKTDEMEHPLLAVKNSELEESDPQEFTEWLDKQISKHGYQLRRIIKYLKGWCDNLSKKHKMPNGLTMTVLACENFVPRVDRDDEALHYTLVRIFTQLDISWECIMPATPNDDLLSQYDKVFQNNFMNALAAIIKDSEEALELDSKHKASKKWNKHLGPRYPLAPHDTKVGSRAALAGVVGSNKPYYSG
jgi:hypothetical protein